MKVQAVSLSKNKPNTTSSKGIINYEVLLEMMHVRHHTRKSIARMCGVTQQAYGHWIKHGLLMPGSVILETARILGVPYERIGEIFFCERTSYSNKKHQKFKSLNVIKGDNQIKTEPYLNLE